MKDALLTAAEQAGKNAHAPYSRYSVGAALQDASGKIFTGCNVENRSYGATVCAERVAVYNAVNAGSKRFQKLAVVSQGGPVPVPCGLCLQTLGEFGLDLEIIASNGSERQIFSLKQLYPKPFGANE